MKKEIRYNINGKIITLALVGVILVCCSCLMYFYDPLHMIVLKLLEMKPGTMFFKLWENPPYDVKMRLYIFNVTNPEEFLRGEEKLNVTEVGPYCYKELLSNQNSTYNEEEGILTFYPFRKFVVDEECSVGNPKLDKLVVPNIPLLGIQSFLTDSSFITNLGFATLSATMGAESFKYITVDEYLWGYEDKLVTMANQFIPSWIDFQKFGIMERLISRDNGNEVVMVLEPGKRKSRYERLLTYTEEMAPYHIVTWNGIEGLTEWGYNPDDDAIGTTKKCELVEGDFDGTIYPRPMRKTSITMFRKAFCRPVVLEYTNEGTTPQGFRVYNYEMPRNLFASPEENPNNECYCVNKDCPKNGLQNIGSCYYDIPIVLSQPHFIYSPKEIINAVNGLNPDPKKHKSIARMQPDLGIPLDGSALRIQVNVGVKDTKYNTKTKPFNNLTVPLLWIDLSCSELPSFVTFLLKVVIDVLPVAQKVLVYLFGILGFALISGAAMLTLFFTKTVIPRSMSIVSEYSPVPIITIPAQYFKEKERRMWT
ncbi:unnamed protein product [Phyllotreta striolata]|uniref:Scavenger receptor class B member 1 n=1 Tax=Phyllotreta striolata TaxID=444603 RepID=A0A9N9XQ93_PHYSR|nr:unnamed protein product [Phyllotreta striolata]